MKPADRLHRFDVCNGDADGLCAVLQWRLHDATSDHHFAGEVPLHDKLEAHLDADPETCTSLLMDSWLSGRFHAWALVGAYGDALTAVAHRRAAAAGFDDKRRTALRRLGEAINYNAYGDDEHDVHIAPAALYRIMARHAEPFEMISDEPVVDELDALRGDDLRRAMAVAPTLRSERACLVVLSDAPWSRRVVGCLANELAAAAPRQAQAVLKHRPAGGFLVSVRAPRAAPHGADRLCAAFGGGGRSAAAGIDALAADQLERFVGAFGGMHWEGGPLPAGREQ